MAPAGYAGDLALTRWRVGRVICAAQAASYSWRESIGVVDIGQDKGGTGLGARGSGSHATNGMVREQVLAVFAATHGLTEGGDQDEVCM